ncbi:MAG: PKD domain-containing protein, partial [Bacteroidota bacterium]
MRWTLYSVIIMVALLIMGTTYGQQTDSTQDDDDEPTATISGTDTKVCLGDSVAATLTFTGRGPWSVVINNNSGKYLTLYRVNSPYTIWLKPEEDDSYYISSVRDRWYRSGDTYGEVEVLVYKSIPVSIQLDITAYLESDPAIHLEATPPGGVFSGNGVSGSLFYPTVATPVGSPHHITYTYTNSDGGCISTDHVDIHVLYGEGEVSLFSGDDVVDAICADGETYEIRGSNLDNITGLFELREAGSTDPVSGHISDKDLKDDEAILDPAGLTGPYDIIYTYEFQDLTISNSFRFTVNNMGSVGISGLPEVVCKNDDPYHLMPEVVENDPGAVYQFSGPGVSGSQEEGYYYNPGDPDAPVGKNQISLDYTSSSGCSFSLTRVVTNAFVPDLQFSLSPVCLPEEGGMVSFKNLTSGKDKVDSWSWDFGDPSSGANNSSSLENPEHFYLQVGSRQITLGATTTAGCEALLTVDTVLSDQPVADFSWISDCFVDGQKSAFVNSSISTFSMLDTSIWTFKTA